MYVNNLTTKRTRADSALKTTALGQAYGVCVMFVTFFDTCMVTLIALFVWRLHPLVVVLPWLFFACLDGTFISSALTKVPNGAWFTITLAIVLALMLLLWRFGKEQQWTAEAKDRRPTSNFIRAHQNGQVFLADRYGGLPVTSIPGFGIFFDKVGENCPMVFSHFALKLTAIPEVAVFLHLRPLETPSVTSEDRFVVSRLALPNCYRLVVRYGYSDEILSQDLARLVFEQIRRYLGHDIIPGNSAVQNSDHRGSLRKIIGLEGDADGQEHEELGDQTLEQALADKPGLVESTTGPPDLSSSDQDSKVTHHEMTTLENAYRHKVLFILGKEELKIRPIQGYNPAKILRTVLLGIYVYVRDNTRSRMANLTLPIDKVIEVGFFKEL